MKKCFILFIPIASLFYSCTKDTGCKDRNAANYNPDAITNDGSCLYYQPKGLPILFNYSYSGSSSSVSYSDTIFFKNFPDKDIDYVFNTSYSGISIYNPVVFEPGTVVGFHNGVQVYFYSSVTCSGQAGSEIQLIYSDYPNKNIANGAWGGFYLRPSISNTNYTFDYVKMKDVSSSSYGAIYYYSYSSSYPIITVYNSIFENVNASCVLNQYHTSTPKIDTANLTFINTTGSKYCW